MEQARQWEDTLQRNAATGYVHRLIIEAGSGDARRCLKMTAEDRGYERRLVDKDPWVRIAADNTPATAVYEADDTWKPLAALSRQLVALEDLIYRCPNQFPPCLLETLHQYLPHYRLHIDPFKLRSLNEPSTDPYEITLATSPCLYSIGVDCDMQHGAITGEVQNFNFDAVQSMVAGLAPNLKEVRVFHAGWGAMFSAFPEGQPWKGFLPRNQKQMIQQELVLCGLFGSELVIFLSASSSLSAGPRELTFLSWSPSICNPKLVQTRWSFWRQVLAFHH